MSAARACVLVAAACALGLAAPATHALASPLLELIGSQDQGGLCARVSTPGAASTYFNPALLAFAQPGLTLGFFVLAERIDIDVDARGEAAACTGGACDVPAVNGAGPESFRHADNSPIAAPTLPTEWLEQGRSDTDGTVTLAPRPRQGQDTGSAEHGYALVGLVQAIVKQRVTLGLYTLFPIGDFLHARAFYSDEREQFFSNSLHPELYADRLTPVSLALGAGVRVTDSLAVGVSLALGIASSAGAPVYVSNLADLDTLLLDSDVGVSLALAPHFGVSYAPVPALRLSATVHSPQSVAIETGFRYVIATGTEQSATQGFTHDYLPWIFGLGAELELGHTGPQRWALAASGTYALWSNYEDRHGERPRGAYAWSDIPAGSLGLRHDVYAFRSFLDLAFQPSPVAEQDGRSNYVDGDRASASLGTSYAFTLIGQHASVGVSAQLHRLLPEHTQKREGGGAGAVRDEVPDDAVGGTPRGPIEGREGLQTNNPGFPGYRSDGLIVGGGATFNLTY